ncbi:Ypt/Rab-GAP domain of gyp1p superfamily protein [Striga hermonthica]|uniref:Ypt/Rab-GAP domain of gyp1p superfamily protein n=1 Tax=Striga hermonthica TaxID=68872 RepID=A0A9N7NDB0_STRHE|nr:Ypt/Rab-GAP domain of gyp1p superfamily protein [Striga hermonthica]
MKAKVPAAPLHALDHKRDAYGFAVRPQHLQRYREYANIYKEEEEERSDRWKDFLDRQSETIRLDTNDLSATNIKAEDSSKNVISEKYKEKQKWTEIRLSLRVIEDWMSSRVKNEVSLISRDEALDKGTCKEDSEEEFHDLDITELDSGQERTSPDCISDGFTLSESRPSWEEELKCLVQGGVPMALRGEMWQAFVGVRTRRIEKYYDNLLDPSFSVEVMKNGLEEKNHYSNLERVGVPEKWKGQIEKDLPRTFPGHPALDEGGRNALRRLLTAYARHNPSVGYCQAMNFFAGLLLLLMPEENAFWTLTGLLDDYFEGYYSEEMIESQVDQLVLEELMHEKFPKIANHLEYLGVQVAWVAAPWFLTIFINMLPWESVLRVWDVLLFEGNRVMLFRTALALMELYGPALVTTKDAGDAVTLLQSLTGSTFDSSQLVLTACMGFQNIHEKRLRELRSKHRLAVFAALEERSKGLKHLDMSLNGDPAKDLHEQAVWLKVEVCKLLEEKQSAELRAEELETALMEMVEHDNRKQLSARVGQLEREVSELRQALLCKHEQENAMLMMLMRAEQEQKATEDARLSAEQDAAAQKYAAQVFQVKCEKENAALVEMENRAVMAESMLEATLQYQSVQYKALHSPRGIDISSSTERGAK